MKLRCPGYAELSMRELREQIRMASVPRYEDRMDPTIIGKAYDKLIIDEATTLNQLDAMTRALLHLHAGGDVQATEALKLKCEQREAFYARVKNGVRTPFLDRLRAKAVAIRMTE